jgi:anti-anti-sigma factor
VQHVEQLISEPGGIRVLALSGEYDLSNSDVLERAGRLLLAGVSAAVVDLTDVGFLDSTVLAWLLRANEAAHAAGIEFVACAAPGSFPRRALGIVAAHVRVCDSRAGALRRLREPASGHA